MMMQYSKRKMRQTQRLKAVFRTAFLVCAAVIIGVNAYTFNASRITCNAVPMPFGIGAAVVLSGSMEPALSVGDLLIIVEQDDYFVGDIIVYQDARLPVTHRIVSMTEDTVITRGDANNTEDEPFSPDLIKGEVTFVIPHIGHMVNAIKSPIGTLVILAAAIFLLEFSFLTEKDHDEKTLKAIKAEIDKLKQEQNRR